MGWKCFDFYCKFCNYKFEELVDHLDDIVHCRQCSRLSAEKVPSCTNIRTSDSATLIDGTRRQTGAYRDLIESYDLESKKYDYPATSSERKEIESEISKLRQVSP